MKYRLLFSRNYRMATVGCISAFDACKGRRKEGSDSACEQLESQEMHLSLTKVRQTVAWESFSHCRMDGGDLNVFRPAAVPATEDLLSASFLSSSL